MAITKNRFEEIFSKSFEIQSFVDFSKEFFNELSLVNPDKFMNDGWNWSEFNFYIEGYHHIGNFIGSDKQDISVFAVKLKDHKNIDRARSMQRNFVKKLISGGNKNAAIAAFYADGDTKWRLSFVKLDYEFVGGKVAEKITPAKRYSYLVGENEPCHTAKERLYPIFQSYHKNPTVSEIEEAFSVEKVTKEFFELYKEKYLQLKEVLENNEDFIFEAKRHNFTSEQFAKKLMGQLAFLYFLQKKGWLGVNALPKTMTQKEYDKAFWRTGKASNIPVSKCYKQVSEDEFRLTAISQLNEDEERILANSVIGKPWGTGPRNFIRALYNECTKKEKNFFDDYLEPLFYEALNENRGESGYFLKLHCRVPFLNGGLFEPLDNYDWIHNDFSIDNSVFSNNNKTGILDIFDTYNFTMNEDEPLEKEVAIDPEMLGKIFENLLDVKDRKSKGAFYTPREIVHYMCQESIANYLVNETAVPYEDIKDFILYGEFMKDEDTTHQAKQGMFEMYISDKIYDKSKGVNNLKLIDDALANIKVADPAVGSGAFPLGMVSEIVKIRKNISAYFAIDMNDYNTKMMYEIDRHPYRLKAETIKNCIFAVDIEPSAVDITKLRLWLSLVVEQQTNENAQNELFVEGKNPNPLPNLDCNIRCGNSLIDEVCGISIIKDSDLFGDNLIGQQQSLGQAKYESLVKQLIDTQDHLFYANNHATKEEHKKRISSIIDTIILNELQGSTPDTIEKYKEEREFASLPYFLWKLEFAKVFRDKGGFDVVIGNPPYGLINKKQNQTTGIFATVEEQHYYKNCIKYAPAKGGSINIYRLFVCLALELLKTDGNLGYIFPMAYMCDLSASTLRKYISKNYSTTYIEAFPERDNERKRVFENVKMSVCILGVEKNKNNQNNVQLRINYDKYVDVKLPKTSLLWSSLMEIDEKGVTIPLVNQNEFNLMKKITHKKTRLKCISKCYTGELDLSLNKKYITEEKTETQLIRGAQVQKYKLTNEISQGALLYLHKNNYLLENSSDKSQHYKHRRILMQGITGVNERYRLKMCFSEEGMFCANSVNYLIPKEEICPSEYLLGLLNSNLLNWFFSKLSTNSNVNGYEIDNLPIIIEPNYFVKMQALVEKSLNNDESSEKDINALVYNIYGLTDEEIQIVEESLK